MNGTVEPQDVGASVSPTGFGSAEAPEPFPSAHEPHCPPAHLGRCNCRVAALAIALGRALKESCLHMGECYAVVDERVAYDGDVCAEVDGEISLMALAEAAFAYFAAVPKGDAQ